MEVEGFLKRAVEMVRKAGVVYIAGNGGMASQSDHLACDILKNAGRKAISLCCNDALVFAIGNDVSFDDIFVEQLKILYEPKDLLIALSTSGQSKNVIKAAKFVWEKNGEVMTISGFDGGKLAEYATLMLILDSRDVQELEDMIGAVCHRLYKGLVGERGIL